MLSLDAILKKSEKIDEKYAAGCCNLGEQYVENRIYIGARPIESRSDWKRLFHV